MAGLYPFPVDSKDSTVQANEQRKERMLTQKMFEWIGKRERRWNILLSLRNGEISLIEAEKRLRKLDAE